jgi:hypothetical protein
MVLGDQDRSQSRYARPAAIPRGVGVALVQDAAPLRSSQQMGVSKSSTAFRPSLEGRTTLLLFSRVDRNRPTT